MHYLSDISLKSAHWQETRDRDRKGAQMRMCKREKVASCQIVEQRNYGVRKKSVWRERTVV